MTHKPMSTGRKPLLRHLDHSLCEIVLVVAFMSIYSLTKHFLFLFQTEGTICLGRERGMLPESAGAGSGDSTPKS
jgi:hypothetical protein